ncbi:hypothetical protein HMPREF3213_00553, partial [Heyndrickxia coagulans]
MEATIEGLRKEISELLEMRNALNQLNALLKKELRELGFAERIRFCQIQA